MITKQTGPVVVRPNILRDQTAPEGLRMNVSDRLGPSALWNRR
jgi:hypothetical protein